MNNNFLKSALIGIAAILLAGLIFLSYEIGKLKAQVSELSGRPFGVSVNKPRVAIAIPRPVDARESFQEDWDPYLEMEQIQRRMNRLMHERLLEESLAPQELPTQNIMNVSVNYQEEKDKYVLRMETPGMKKDDIRIEVKDHTLFVIGEHREEQKEKNPQYVSEEQTSGYFSQAFPLPNDANTKAIKVRYEQGVLMIDIPRLVSKKNNQESGSIKVHQR